ncbi:hypothetical protein P4S64_05715 [Vibrio sp. M60_M31a]|jgi:hypothetical protein
MGTGAPTSEALARDATVASISNSEAATVRNFINVLFKVSEKQKIAKGSALLDKIIGKPALSFRQFLPLTTERRQQVATLRRVFHNRSIPLHKSIRHKKADLKVGFQNL